MHKSLFLLCPTDCLEMVINHQFKQENYFYTSLGNSFVSDIDTLINIKDVIKKHNITNIYFVLSSDNEIILDALGGQFFSKVKGLKTFYNEIEKQKKHSEASWQMNTSRFSILSYYLNQKIKELKYLLNSLYLNDVRVFGKIYNKQQNIFTNIYSDLVCLEKHCLN
ncbi:hypothetical protein [Tenacibaculum sp. 190524A02b]|uniref:Uncharacterized protein n=1 Tax=Tenacibaculum vairaonense TaxID=3137860 RepID=A0ABP1FBJ9_9FLAO